MGMTGKSLIVYRRDEAPHPLDRLVSSGNINGHPCQLNITFIDGGHLVATVNGKSVAIAFNELLSIALAEAQ